MAKALALFSIKRTGDEYLVTIEDQDGDKTKFTADEEQLELIVETIEDRDDDEEEEEDTLDDDGNGDLDDE